MIFGKQKKFADTMQPVNCFWDSCAIFYFYVAVAKEIGRSPSSVSKYVQMKGVPTNIRIAVENLTQNL